MKDLVGKVVVYNGGMDSYYSCSDYRKLEIGKRYVVISANERSWQTDLSLKGVEGEFNSVWFDEVKEYGLKKEWLAVATLYNQPDTFVGKRVLLQRIHVDTKLVETVTTSEIIRVRNLYGNIYLFETTNSVYVTKVNLRTGC